jgi:hypothetical protein
MIERGLVKIVSSGSQHGYATLEIISGGGLVNDIDANRRTTVILFLLRLLCIYWGGIVRKEKLH